MNRLASFLVVVAALAPHAQQVRDAPARPLTPEEIRKIHDQQFLGGTPSLIPYLLATTRGDVVVPPPDVDITPSGNNQAPRVLVRALVCRYPLTALGTFGERSGHLTSNKSWIYTEGTFHIDEVIRNNTSVPISAPSDITYLASGGTLTIDGRRVTTQSPSPVLPPKQDRRYLITFDRFLKNTGAFLGGNGGWDLGCSKPAPLAESLRINDVTTSELLQWSREASTTSTAEGGCKAGGLQ